MLIVDFNWKSYIVTGPVDELNELQEKIGKIIGEYRSKCMRTGPNQLVVTYPIPGLDPAIDQAMSGREKQPALL